MATPLKCESVVSFGSDANKQKKTLTSVKHTSVKHTFSKSLGKNSIVRVRDVSRVFTYSLYLLNKADASQCVWVVHFHVGSLGKHLTFYTVTQIRSLQVQGLWGETLQVPVCL